MEAKKETKKFTKITGRMNEFLREMVNEKDQKKVITDRVEEEVAVYLTKVGKGSLTGETSAKIRALHKMISNLERIGDIYYRMSITLQNKRESKVWFNQNQRDSLNKYFEKLELTFKEAHENLEHEFGNVSLDKAKGLEHENNIYLDKLHEQHVIDLEKGEYDFKSAMHYRDLYMACEKVGDHLINVSESMQLKI